MYIKLSGEIMTLPDDAAVLAPPQAPAPSGYCGLACAAMDRPLDKPPLAEWDLAGKKIAVMVDDWGRPTPASEFLPEVMKRLKSAGAAAESVTVITASGMHDPMGEADLCRKVGGEIFYSVRCVSHDAGVTENLSFIGITDTGTPVWINKYVAEADVRLAFGRIFPHSNYGYEGGYKMIVPGVASYETIMRDHSMNFSPLSDYGVLRGNPSREEADAIGRMVGLDFIVNFVMDFGQRPVAAFGGSPEEVFANGVNFGQRNVWGAVTGRPADVTILCAGGEEAFELADNPTYFLGMAMSVTKPLGAVIAKMDYRPVQPVIVHGHNLDEIPFDHLLRLHEKRDWNLDYRAIQHVVKSIRGAFYRRRIYEHRTQRLFLVSERGYPKSTLEKWKAACFTDIKQAYSAASAGLSRPFVTGIPEGDRTLPLLKYDFS